MPLAFYYIFANGYLTEAGMKHATGWMTSASSLKSSLCWLCRSLPNALVLKGSVAGLITAAIRYGFFVYGGAENYFTYTLMFLGILLHGVSYDFTTSPPISTSIKKRRYRCAMRPGLITLCCQGFGSLLGYRLGGVMMEKMFAKEPVNGLTFNWAGMWTFGAIMIAIIAVLFMVFFRESDKEITTIDVDTGDAELKQGEVNESRTYSRCSLRAGVRGCDGHAVGAMATNAVKAHFGWIDRFLPGPAENNAACYFAEAEFTDDTSMALCLADAIIECDGQIVPDVIGRHILLGRRL
jgi:hypothetical protein